MSRPPSSRTGVADHPRVVGALGDVGFDCGGGRAGFSHGLGGALGAAGIDVDDGDACAGAGHLKGDATPDAHAAAGDERHAALEFHA